MLQLLCARADGTHRMNEMTLAEVDTTLDSAERSREYSIGILGGSNPASAFWRNRGPISKMFDPVESIGFDDRCRAEKELDDGAARLNELVEALTLR